MTERVPFSDLPVSAMDEHLAFLVFRNLRREPNGFRLRIAMGRVAVITFSAHCPAVLALNYMLVLSHVIDSLLSPKLAFGHHHWQQETFQFLLSLVADRERRLLHIHFPRRRYPSPLRPNCKANLHGTATCDTLARIFEFGGPKWHSSERASPPRHGAEQPRPVPEAPAEA